MKEGSGGRADNSDGRHGEAREWFKYGWIRKVKRGGMDGASRGRMKERRVKDKKERGEGEVVGRIENGEGYGGWWGGW